MSQLTDEPEKETAMCLTCGCMQAHKVMSDADITYKDVMKAADQNGVSVDQILETIGKTADKDRLDHASEYSKTGTA
jgi:hypothetical protein